MAAGDLKIYEFNYTGLELKITAVDNGDGTTKFIIECISGSADINALYWSDGDTTANESTFQNGTFGGPLSMSGSGVAWDGGYKLSNPGAAGPGVPVASKPTFLTAGEIYAFDAAVALDFIETLGVRATSTSTDAGSIKGVDTTPDEYPCPEISIANAAEVCEGDGNDAEFVITLSSAYPYDITLTYSTGGGSATGGDDYASATSQTITIPAGETTATINVAIVDDDDVEGGENFFVTIEAATADLPGNNDITVFHCVVDATGEGAICDNDTVGPPPPGNDFPLWRQDISNVVLYFDTAPGDPDDTKPTGGDGYVLVKIDGWSGSDDLDSSIDEILAYLASTGDYPTLTAETLVGAAIKGGTQTTQYFAYGDSNTNGTDPDTIPAGAPDFETPPIQGQVPGNDIDVTLTYDLVFA